MKRLHMGVSVEDLDQSIRFYSTLFGAQPTVVEADYAKWMLEDPRVNFAIAVGRAAEKRGIDHVGIQTDSPEELAEITRRLNEAGEASLQQKAAQCCYAVSDKTWVEDPSGLRWETFYTHGAITTYGKDLGPLRSGDIRAESADAQGKCC